MSDLYPGAEQAINRTRIQAVTGILEELEKNDAKYLASEIERTEWLETAKQLDEKLGVAGLRLAVRPWVK